MKSDKELAHRKANNKMILEMLGKSKVSFDSYEEDRPTLVLCPDGVIRTKESWERYQKNECKVIAFPKGKACGDK